MLHEVEQEDSFSFTAQRPKAGLFSTHPLYQALVTMVDRIELSCYLSESSRPDGRFRPRDVAHFQSLIIARTGAEEHLSAPISFESLQNKALPLDRSDLDGEPYVDVIRVPLPDAVRFVVDLEKREDAAAFGDKTTPSIDRRLSHTCHK